MRQLCFTLLLFTFVAYSSADATDWTVLPDGTGDQPTIQAAVDAASTGDTILLADGTFSGPGNRDVDLLGKSITVRSLSGLPTACIVDCEGSAQSPRRGFLLQSQEDSTTVLQDFTITGAWTDSRGGAIYIEDASPTLFNLHLTNNQGTGDGTAVFAWLSSKFTLVGSEVSHNTGRSSVEIQEIAEVALQGNLFANNQGDALWSRNGEQTMEIRDCTFDSNERSFEIGGEYFELTMTGCSLTNNDDAGFFYGAEPGGPIAARQFGIATLESCLVENNSMRLRLGGALVTVRESQFFDNAPHGALESIGETVIMIEDSTFERNSSSENGGAFRFSGDSSGNIIRSAFVDNSSSGDGGAIYENAAWSLQADSVSFISNHADLRGGAWYKAHPFLSFETEVQHSLFADNSALEGGAVYFVESEFRATSCTFAMNRANEGADFWVLGEIPSALVLQDCILAFGEGEAIACEQNELIPGVFEASCTNIFGHTGGSWTGCFEEDLGVSGNISADPLFCDRTNFDFSLASDSPSLDSSCGTMGYRTEEGCKVPAEAPPTPASARLGLSCAPNPFSNRIVFQVAATGTGPVDLTIYDASGKRIRSLGSGLSSTSPVDVEWDGRNDEGAVVANGVYFCSARTPTGSETVRVVSLMD